jgi:glucose-6-phosphate 1-epimerase
MPPTAADLRPLEIPGIATLTDLPGGLVAIDISTPEASGRVFLHGAHVATWQPAGHRPVLFMSTESHFTPGKAIRGGIPMIFPWFGARAGNPQTPQHGFGRTTIWELESLDRASDGVSIALQLSDSDRTRANWPHAFHARFRVAFGARLGLALEIENRSTMAMTFEEAFHSYFAVSDVRNVSVTGLAQTEFIDKVDGATRKRLGTEPLTFSGETDRVFLNTRTATVLHDPGMKRQIGIEKTGSASTVVWNPWLTKAKAMADFGDEEWSGMLCIETANADENAIALAPGATHTMTAEIHLAFSI